MQISSSPITADLFKRSPSTPSHAQGFVNHLTGPRDPATDRTRVSPANEAYEAAQSLVAITLIQPLLAQAREDPFKSDLFHGGFAEDTFGSQLDSIIAERITQSSRLPIVESIYNRITPNPSQVDTHG